MGNTIWVWLEQDRGELMEASKEILGEGRKLAGKLKGEVVAFLCGEGSDGAAAEAIAYGADIVRLAADPVFNDFSIENCIAVLDKEAERGAPRLVLIAATPNGAGLAPRIAAHFQWGYLANVVKTSIQDDGSLQINTEGFQDKVNRVYTFTARQTVVLTMTPGSLGVDKADKKRVGEVTYLELEDTAASRTEVRGFVKADPRSVSLGEAERIAAGGNGFRKQEDIQILQDFADAVGAAVGCSKPIADKGWLPYSRMVGQSSGRRLAPKLFVSAGVSGATHFVEGMKDARFIIAINKDKGAPIMKEADLAVVGDLYEILPEVTEQIKAKRKEAEGHEQ